MSAATRNYTLQHFMTYPYLAFRLAMIVPFDDGVISADGAPQRGQRPALDTLKRSWFAFGALNLIYQNFGMLIYLFTAAPTDAADEPILGQISETGGVMGLTLVGACKMFILLWHGARISALLQQFQQLLPTAPQQQSVTGVRGIHSRYRVEHYSRTSNHLMKCTTIFFLFAFCVYNLLPIGDLIYDALLRSSQRCPTAPYRYQSNTWYPWQSPQRNNNAHSASIIAFVAAYLCQLQSSLTGVAFIMGGEFMLCFFITQMQMHFDYLANALSTLDASAPDANAQLKYLINYHSRLLSFSKEINYIFDVSLMVNFFTSTIAICLMGFSMLTISAADAFKYSIGLLSFLVFTLFICYNGSEFTQASEQLMPAAFYGNWYEGDLPYRKMILFFIMRARIPNVLQAYKFTTASMATYMALLRSSYRLFTFIRALG